MVMETKVVVMVVAVIIEDIAKGPVGPDTYDEARRELIVEAALHDADDVAIRRLVKVVMEIPIRIAGPVVEEPAAPVIDVDIGPPDAATGAEVETRPAADGR